MDTIQFSTNWNNKLDCRCFTTIRVINPAKYKIGETYNISLKGKLLKMAKIVGIRRFFLKDMTEYVARLDTGYSKAETTRIIHRMYQKGNIDFNKTRLYFILLESLKPSK